MQDVVRKKDKGVSAIVGTILIVAITVVLAATVYGVLTGFGGLIGGTPPTGAISVSSGSTSYTISVTQLSSSSVPWTHVELKYTTSSTTVLGPPLKNSTAVEISTPTLNINTVITLNVTGATSIMLVDTSPSGTIASWSS